MALRRVLLSLVILFFTVVSCQAQTVQTNRSPISQGPMQYCTGTVIEVENSAGGAIMGAVVLVDDGLSRFTTDVMGKALIPCSSSAGKWMKVEISAPGYRTAEASFVPARNSRFGVTLDNLQNSYKDTRMTISAQELSKPVQKEIDGLEDQVQRAMQQKDYRTAELLLIQVMGLNPANAAVLNNLGVVALYRNDLVAANRWFEEAMELAPYSADIVANLGILRWWQQREEESYKLLLRAAEMGYETAASNYIISTVSIRKGKNKEAVERLKKLSSDRFPYRDYYLSKALGNLGKTKASHLAYRNFLKRNPFPFAVDAPHISSDGPILAANN